MLLAHNFDFHGNILCLVTEADLHFLNSERNGISCKSGVITSGELAVNTRDGYSALAAFSTESPTTFALQFSLTGLA
ncbi:MAG: hypothetical protein H7318_05200 [Oligoflexus sp.]|nr:hypothetical protein [Oligoflexus sp.]